MILLVENSLIKIAHLKRSGLTPIIIKTSIGLDEFLASPEIHSLGTAVVDVGEFDGFRQDDMLERGHRLAALGWRIVFWSSLANPARISQECWYEADNSVPAAERIVKAIASDFENCDLKRGQLPANYELTLQTLSGLLPFGLVWEAKDKDAALALPKGNDYEGLLIARLGEHINWSSSAFGNYVSRMDKLLADRAGETKVVGIWQTVGIEPPPGDLDSALRQLAQSDSPSQWNQRLTALRRTLLDFE
jgi:hypothetical protein